MRRRRALRKTPTNDRGNRSGLTKCPHFAASNCSPNGLIKIAAEKGREKVGAAWFACLHTPAAAADKGASIYDVRTGGGGVMEKRT